MRVRIFPLLVLAILWFVLACTAPPLTSETPPATRPIDVGSSDWRSVDHVFVVTDASGTMYDARTFPKAKALSQAFVDALPERTARAEHDAYNAANIGFGGKTRVSLPLQPFDRRSLRDSVDRVQVMGEVDGTGGTTPLHRVFDEIRQQLAGKTGRAAVVIFSDGVPDDAGAAVDAAALLAHDHPAGICFHGVQLGNDPAGVGLFKELAAVSSRCSSARNAADVSTAQQVTRFTQGVMLAQAPAPKALPPVAAPPPDACKGITLRNIQFAHDRATLDGGGTSALDRAADQLRKCPDVRLRIEGHTDPRGSARYNQRLSEQRAAAVRSYLVERGVASDRLQAEGRGESGLLDKADSEQAWAKNRRVELKVR